MAERSGLENLERWKQTAVILSDKDIENLKTKTEEAMKQKKESVNRFIILRLCFELFAFRKSES